MKIGIIAWGSLVCVSAAEAYLVGLPKTARKVAVEYREGSSRSRDFASQILGEMWNDFRTGEVGRDIVGWCSFSPSVMVATWLTSGQELV